jgi:hypothetical protein
MLAVLGALTFSATAATADAATLAVPAACLPQNELDIPVSGTGFSPNSEVAVTGAPVPFTGITDATGGFQTTFLTPANDSFVPRPATLTATDTVNPAVTATASFQVVRFGSNLPLTGRPTATTTWRFAGFTAGKSIYGHFRFGGKTVRNYRFGKASGVCGTLKATARRLPARSRPGTWKLQIDQRMTYSDATRPRVTASFTIRRTFF